MKHLFAVLFVFALISCKQGSGTDITGNADPEQAVAVNKNGVLSMVDEASIASSWESNMGDGSRLTAFEVVKGKTEGDTQEEFYMLVARTDKGTAMVASLLELKEDKFYFSSGKDTGSYVLVICKGECEGGCLPVAKNANGTTRLICSSCADCEKNEIGVR
ncbi:hypothetical protein [Flavobacterium sp.]